MTASFIFSGVTCRMDKTRRVAEHTGRTVNPSDNAVVASASGVLEPQAAGRLYLIPLEFTGRSLVSRRLAG